MSESTIQARFLDSMPSIRPFRSGEGKLFERQLATEQQKAKAALSGIGFAGSAS